MKVFFARDYDKSTDATPWVKMRAFDEEHAAEQFAEDIWADGDYFNDCEVEVKDQAGKITHWSVVVEQEPVFRASLIE